ncbi:MAG: D-alanyl carrier protein:peptidoglycan D-alanyltransferase [Bacteroidota bacterium]|jgi:D-alanine transfer protein
MQLLRHLAAVLIAVSISFFVIFNYNKENNKQTNTAPTIFSVKNNSNYGTGNDVMQNIYTSLNTGNRVVVFGSSELTLETDSAIPYNFFNDKLHIPLVAIGHAGNQSFSMFCQLAAMNHSLENSKTVIILSPGWMNGKSGNGTAISCFLEYLSEPMLYKMYFDKNLPDEFKNYIASYINNHFQEIGNPNSIILLWNLKALQNQNKFDGIRYSLSNWIEYLYCSAHYFSKKTDWNMVDKNNSGNIFTNKFTPNWDSLQHIGLKNEAAKCSNQYGVNDEYYKANCINQLPHEFENPLQPNQELHDIKMLIQLCKYYKMKPLFVMQALNPNAYDGLEKMTPLVNEVDSIIKQNGFTMINFWADKKENYTKGTLTDIMHLGEYGWYQIDEAIYNYFSKK